jgi:F-type H+-transporting ATPase subunit delta
MSEPLETKVEPITADVGAERIARVYAEALFDAAQEKGQASDVQAELDSLIGDVFRANPELEDFFSSGAAGRDRKKDLIQKTFPGRSSEIFTNFLLVLNHHDRLDLLRPIQRAYRELFQERSGQMTVEVRSAAPLSDEQRERLKRDLQETFKREPILVATVDPDLLGGLRVQVGDWLYDATVRTQINTIRNQLIERSSHAIQSGRDRLYSET